MKKFKKIKLIKLSDDYFEGNHPNGIHEGYTKIGFLRKLPTIGERFHVICNEGFSTSVVTEELNKDNIFKTTYSTYKIEFLD
jgi:hypothetical protein